MQADLDISIKAPYNPEAGIDELRDKYIHWSGGPESPGADYMVPLVRKTHAKGYYRTGLAKEAAIDENGFLLPEIDKSGHYQEDINYYLAINPNDSDEMSTARVVSKQDIEALPTYDLVKDGLESDVLSRIREETSSGLVVQEVTALANSKARHNPGSTEIMRKIVAESISQDDRSERVLFCSLVDVVLRGLRRSLAHENFKQIGDTVVLEENEYRNETTLVPVIIKPDEFIFNLVKASREAERPVEQKRLYGNALLFASLYPEAPQVPEEIKDKLGSLRHRVQEDDDAA